MVRLAVLLRPLCRLRGQPILGIGVFAGGLFSEFSCRPLHLPKEGIVRYFILQGRQPVPVETHLQWALWCGSHAEDAVVGCDQVDGVEITTAFVGVNTQNGPSAEALVFQTLCERGAETEVVGNYATWEEAERGHQDALRRVSVRTVATGHRPTNGIGNGHSTGLGRMKKVPVEI